MDKDDDTTIFVAYKDKTHNLGIIDRDKFSRVSVINKVMVRVYGRNMLFEEEFNLSIWQPWDCKEAQIDTDKDLIFQLKEHIHHLIYYMQLHLDKIPQSHVFVAKRVLFQPSEVNSFTSPQTNSPATLNLNDPIPLPLHNSTNRTDSNIIPNDTLLPKLEVEIPINATTTIMKCLVAPDYVQSQLNSQKTPSFTITKLQNKFDANSDLFRDFLDTYFISPTQNHITFPTQAQAVTSTQTSDTEHMHEVSDNNGDKTSCYTPESPSQQLPQTFTQSPNLSRLLNEHKNIEQTSEATFTPVYQNDMASSPLIQNPESQHVYASNLFNDSSEQAGRLNSKSAAAAEYDSEDGVFSLLDSDEDPAHPLGAPNVINPAANTVSEPQLAFVLSDDSDGDCMLSDFESDNDDLGIVSDDEVDGVLAKMKAIVRENMYIPGWDPVIFRVGMYFRSFRVLAWAIRQYAIENKFKVYRHKFERARITVGCAYYNCPWFLHAARTRFGGVYMLKRLHNVHTCSRELDNPECTAEFIAAKYGQTFIDHPDTKVDFIQDELRRIYGCKVNRFKVYKVKKIALRKAGADHELSYRLIRSYAQMILNKMPEALALFSVIRFPWEQSRTHFDRVILSFPALRDGFKAGCRPFIGIDGCHLKGPYKGVLLSVVAIDANTGIFPIAVCVCSVENTSTWTWFLGHLKTFIEDRRQLTFMCDRQKGIQNALALEFPNGHVRFCSRHILANLKAKHPRTNFKPYFWAAARTCNRRDFDKAMTDLMKEDEGVYETLRRLPAKFWSRHAFDNSCKTDHCTNNMTESFNAWLGVQRKVPLLSMLEWIRKKLMKRMVNRRKKAEAWESDIPKKIYDKMMKNLQIGSPNPVARASEWLYEVDHIHKTYIVDLEHHVCDCGHWQVSGISCIHAMPCILHSRKELGQFISPLLNRGSYLSTYAGIIHPIPDKSSWPITAGDEIFPPMMKMPPGRPKMNRRREADEVPAEKRRYKMQCKYCKEFGHNKRGCPIHPLNANKSTRHYKSNLKSYMTRIGSVTRGLQGRTNSIFDSAPGNGSTVSHMQAHEQVRVTVEVHEPQEAQMPPAKKNKIGNHEGPSGTKKIISRLPANVQPDAPWLGVQGKKIIAAGGITLKEKHNGPKRSKLKNIDKGKGPAFPPYM